MFKFILRLLTVCFLILLSYGVFLGFQAFQVQKILSSYAEDPNPQVKGVFDTAKAFLGESDRPLRGEKEGRINILLLGLGGEGHKGKDLTDTIMLASINPQTYQTSLFSIPRDLYVNIPETRVHTKINAVYAYGRRNKNLGDSQAINGIKATVEEITAQKIHYFVALDFEGFQQIIEELGGIDLEVPKDIYDPRFPGPNYSYETFEIEKGYQHLDAETALKYARVRHTSGGDFGRAARQQQVIAAAKKKALSLGTLTNPARINRLVKTLGKHLKTDIQLSEIPAFLELGRNVNVYQTTNYVLDAWSKDALLASSHVPLGGVSAYVLLPRARNYSQVQAVAENIFDLNQIKQKRAAIQKEAANLAVVPPRGGHYYRTEKIFRDFGYAQVTFKSPSFGDGLCVGQDALVSFSDPTKAYTLSDLAEKLETRVIYRKDLISSYDIVICLTEESLDYFEAQENQDQNSQKPENEKPAPIVDQDGQVLVNEE